MVITSPNIFNLESVGTMAMRLVKTQPYDPTVDNKDISTQNFGSGIVNHFASTAGDHTTLVREKNVTARKIFEQTK